MIWRQAFATSDKHETWPHRQPWAKPGCSRPEDVLPQEMAVTGWWTTDEHWRPKAIGSPTADSPPRLPEDLTEGKIPRQRYMWQVQQGPTQVQAATAQCAHLAQNSQAAKPFDPKHHDQPKQLGSPHQLPWGSERVEKEQALQAQTA